MNLFCIQTEKREPENTERRSWFIIADSLLEAMSSLPEGLSVKAVEVKLATVAGPSQVVGRTDAHYPLQATRSNGGRRLYS